MATKTHVSEELLAPQVRGEITVDEAVAVTAARTI